ncbi:MAG: flagellar export chaperone FliS [Vicinamibacterales bacterium]
MYQQGLNAYRRTEVQSRTPLELVVMLYDGALRFTSQAREAIERRDIRARRDATSRLLAIVSELQNTLDLEKGGEVAVQLDGLYDYMTAKIVESSTKNDVAPLDEVRKLLEPLRDAWQTIASASQPASSVATPAIPVGALPAQPSVTVGAKELPI